MGKASSPQRSESQHHLRHPAISYPTCEVSSGRFDPNFINNLLTLLRCWNFDHRWNTTEHSQAFRRHTSLRRKMCGIDIRASLSRSWRLHLLQPQTKMLRFPGPGFFRRWQLQVTKHNLKSSTSVDLFWKDVGSTIECFTEWFVAQYEVTYSRIFCHD